MVVRFSCVFFSLAFYCFMVIIFTGGEPIASFTPDSTDVELILIGLTPIIVVSPVEVVSFPSVYSLLGEGSSTKSIFPMTVDSITHFNEVI